jgi:HEAT repeat protein
MLDDKLIFPLIKEVGFIQLYEKKLVSNRLSTALRAYAADRLGRMRSEESVDALCQVLNEKHGNEELTDSILKAMALIGSAKALDCIITAFPLILSKELITPKNGEMILLMFAPLHHEALVIALRNFYQADERLCTIVMLDALSRSEVTLDMVTVAREILNTQDVELLVRSLRLIANAGANMVAISLPEIKDYLHDEHWFVRVQAIEATRRFMNKDSFSHMIPLLRDAHWQVRRAAAGAIVSHGDEGLETIVEVIESKDVYAKEAICEAIHLEGYVEQLVRHLTQSSLLYNSSARILFYMMSIGLDSGLKEMALSYPNDEIRQNLHLLMYPEGSEND